MMIGNKGKSASAADIAEYEKLHVGPASKKDSEKDKKTHNLMYLYVGFGVALGLFFVFFYALPYMRAMG